jgi:hypothetical protein
VCIALFPPLLRERGKEKDKIFQRNKHTTTTSMGGRGWGHARPYSYQLKERINFAFGKRIFVV